MKLTEIGIVIAERELVSMAEPGAGHLVKIRIGLPQQFPDSSDYYVPYRIEGIGTQKVRYAGGIDAIQALELVMILIGADLFALNQECGGCLRWVGGASGNLGFPDPENSNPG
jgi:hypothetical protein